MTMLPGWVRYDMGDDLDVWFQFCQLREENEIRYGVAPVGALEHSSDVYRVRPVGLEGEPGQPACEVVFVNLAREAIIWWEPDLPDEISMEACYRFHRDGL